MALNPNTNGNMAGRITAPDANYPYGSSRDETSAGAGDGTPYFKARADDIFGFQQALLLAASIVPSGNADTAISSQYLDSLRVLSQFPYSPLINEYPVNARVIGSDGEVYKCLIANGVSTTVVDPVGDVTGTWVSDGGIGVNQTRVNYSSSGRALGVTYTNSTGKPRFVDVTLQDVNAGDNATIIVTINGNIHGRVDANATLSAAASKSFVVQDGESYSVNGAAADNILYWWELN